MRDFTLKAYTQYLEVIKQKGIPFYLYRDFMRYTEYPKTFCLIRHDVDRKPHNALKMAKIEAEMGIHSTYYFRFKKQTFNGEIIKEIQKLGHEIGYHYETLSDSNGDIDLAIQLFERNLKIFSEFARIETCSMHGRPFKPFDNRDIWRNKANHKRLIDDFKLIGEVYLDIDYSDIAYINDTGRNWTSGKSNIRDKVKSNIKSDFTSREELLNYFKQNSHQKLCFQIHPERWTDNILKWYFQLLLDCGINSIKRIISMTKNG
jgi:hypothetical protein